MPDHVVAPDGLEWVVGRRWLPRPPRWVGAAFSEWRHRNEAEVPYAPLLEEDEPAERRRSDWWEAIGGLGDLTAGADDIGGPVIAVVGLVVVTIVIAVAFVAFVVPAVIFVVDLLFVLVIAGGRCSRGSCSADRGSSSPRTICTRTSGRSSAGRRAGAAVELVKRAIARGEPLEALRLRLL
jgi:hypothetical protein